MDATAKATVVPETAGANATVTPINQNSPTPINQNSVQNSNMGSGNMGSNEGMPRATETSSRAGGSDLVERIRARAYELFEQRGRLEGYDQQDWAQAEAEVLAEFQREKSA